MTRLIYSVSMSADGYIAGPDGDMSWLADHLGDNPEADALVPRIGAMLVGRRTFDGDDPNAGTEEEGAFGGTWEGEVIVLAHRPPSDPIPNVTFASDLREAVSLAKEAAGEVEVNVLGASVARQCLEIGALDDVLTIVVPVLLGDGTRLFEVPGGRQVPLELVHATPLPHATNLWYQVPR